MAELKRSRLANLSKGSARESIVLGFFNSEENRKLLVSGWFEQYMNRAPSTAELHQYVTADSMSAHRSGPCRST